MKKEDKRQRMDWADVLASISSKEPAISSILAGALLEELLLGAIKFNFVKLTLREEDSLFEGSGPLATFSAKIRIAYGMGLLSKAARDDLDLIRDIRNRYAHRLTKPQVSDTLFGHKVLQLKAISAENRQMKAGETLSLACERLCYYLISRTSPPSFAFSSDIRDHLKTLDFDEVNPPKLREM